MFCLQDCRASAKAGLQQMEPPMSLRELCLPVPEKIHLQEAVAEILRNLARPRSQKDCRERLLEDNPDYSC